MARPEDAEEFRLRPNRAPAGGKGEARAWSVALRTILKYAGTSRRSAGSGTTGAGGGRKMQQRCAVRITYASPKTPGQWRAHGRYIARDGAGTPVFGSVEGEAGATLGRWQSEGDPRLWKLIVSPEFGERADMERLARDLMARMEKDLGTRLEWVAVVHRNTEHPHVHIALRGVREDGAALDLPRDYAKRGVRAIAEDLCTRQIGHRTRDDAVAAERREVQERRFTSLDRAIARQASQQSVEDSARFVVHRPARPKPTGRDQHINARLLVLQTMGLAERTTPDQWAVRRDFETVLRAMQRTTDRQKTLAAHGALLSDQRLPLVVLDFRKLKSVEGRVLGHGEDESGRHYMLLEGVDAKVYLIYYSPELERARSSGKLRPNSFVRLQKQFEDSRPELQVRDEGDAELLLNDPKHFADRIGRRSPQHQADANWGGWLGRYLALTSAKLNAKTEARVYQER